MIVFKIQFNQSFKLESSSEISTSVFKINNQLSPNQIIYCRKLKNRTAVYT